MATDSKGGTDIGVVEVALAVAAGGFFLFTIPRDIGSDNQIIQNVISVVRTLGAFVFHMAGYGALFQFWRYIQEHEKGKPTPELWMIFASMVALAGTLTILIWIPVLGNFLQNS